MSSNTESSGKPDERSQIDENRIARRDFLKRQSLVALAPIAMLIAQKLGVGVVFADSVVPQRRYSYTVFIDANDGNLIKALNNTTGKIDYSSQDATQVIQYAIGAAPNGGSIMIKRGTYPLSSSLKSNGVNGIELCGEGNLTVLRLANSVNRPVISITSVNNWHVHDLQIDGNKTSQASNSQSAYGIQTWNCTNIVIENCYVHDCMTFGIGMSKGSNSSVLNNHVNNSGANGITIDNQEGGGGITVQGNVVDGASDVGITAWVGSNLLIANNQVMNINHNDSPFGGNTHLGMMAEGTSTVGSTGVTYSGNIVTACAASGFSSCPGANAFNTNITLQGNQISNCGKCGAYFGRTTGSIAQNNTISNCSLDGILLGDSSSNDAISGNQVSKCKSGVNVAGPNAKNDTVTSNTLTGNGVALIDNGTGTVKTGNIT